MKNVNKLSLIIALLLFTSISSAQERVNKGDMVIHARITTAKMGDNLMDIEKRGNKAEIIYRSFDSIPRAEVRKDTAYIRISKNFTAGDYNKLRELKAISDSYAIYKTTKTTVDLKADTTYRKILELFGQTNKEELETSKIGERIMLDGYSFSGEIITNSEIKNFSIHTPTDKSHPIASALLEESYNRLWENRKK